MSTRLGDDDATVSELLRRRADHLTTSERKVTQILHSDYPRAGLESLPKLAARAGVSAPTVLRLVAKLGYSGYPEFQDALRSEVQQRMSEPVDRVESTTPDNETGDGFEAQFAIMKRSLTSTDRRLERVEFAKIVALLADQSRKVVTLGGLESNVCAFHLANLLSQVRGDVRHLQRELPLIDVLDVGKKHVVVAFDFRRYSRNTSEYVNRAARHKAKVIVVTDKWISPAVAHAQHVVICDTAGAAPFDSRTSAIAVIEVLMSSVTQALGMKADERLRHFYEFLAGSTFAEGLVDSSN